MDNEFKLKNGSGCLYCKGCGRQDKQLNTYDWLADIPGNTEEQEMVEVQFKNTRKGYYKNSNKLKLEKGDIVAVEASPGHDIGTVTLTGRLVPLQMRKANIKPDAEIKRIYRKAKPVDMEKYEEAKAKEHDTMIRSRQIAKNLNLDMKIGDVEYQGDGNKAIFYYIKLEDVEREYLTQDELITLAQTPCENDQLRKASLFSALTALRYSDVYALTWDNVREVPGMGTCLVFRTQKTRAQSSLLFVRMLSNFSVSVAQANYFQTSRNR